MQGSAVIYMTCWLILSNTVDKVVQVTLQAPKVARRGVGGRGKPVSTTASVTWMALQGHLLTFEQWCKLSQQHDSRAASDSFKAEGTSWIVLACSLDGSA